MVKNVENEGGLMGGLKSGDSLPKGRVQKEVLEMLTGNETLTINQVANRRGTSVQAVYNIIWKLKKQGFLSGTSFRGFNREQARGAGGFNLCLHSQRFVAKLLGFDTIYSNEQYLHHLSNKGIMFKGNTIKIRSNCIEVYSLKRFNANSTEECDAKGLSYWKVYFEALQVKYGAILLKQDHYNITETYCHIAMLENGIAYNQNIKRDRIMYYDNETDKLCIQTDSSFRGNDLEFEGAKARKDSILLKKHLESMRNPLTPTNTELHKLIAEVVHLEVIRSVGSQAGIVPSAQTESKKDKELPSYFG